MDDFGLYVVSSYGIGVKLSRNLADMHLPYDSIAACALHYFFEILSCRTMGWPMALP